MRDVCYVFKTRHATQADALEEAEEMRISARSIQTITSPGRMADSPRSNEEAYKRAGTRVGAVIGPEEPSHDGFFSSK